MGYEIRYRLKGGSDKDWSSENVIIYTSDAKAIVYNLEAETEYEFQVRTLIDDVKSEWSKSIFVPTPPLNGIVVTTLVLQRNIMSIYTGEYGVNQCLAERFVSVSFAGGKTLPMRCVVGSIR